MIHKTGISEYCSQLCTFVQSSICIIYCTPSVDKATENKSSVVTITLPPKANRAIHAYGLFHGTRIHDYVISQIISQNPIQAVSLMLECALAHSKQLEHANLTGFS